MRQLERGLPAELNDNAQNFTARLFFANDLDDILAGQRFEIQTIRRIIIRRNGFGITVDHNRLEPRLAQSHHRMNAAIIEFDPLPDAVGSATQNDNFLFI